MTRNTDILERFEEAIDSSSTEVMEAAVVYMVVWSCRRAGIKQSLQSSIVMEALNTAKDQLRPSSWESKTPEDLYDGFQGVVSRVVYLDYTGSTDKRSLNRRHQDRVNGQQLCDLCEKTVAVAEAKDPAAAKRLDDFLSGRLHVETATDEDRDLFSVCFAVALDTYTERSNFLVWLRERLRRSENFLQTVLIIATYLVGLTAGLA